MKYHALLPATPQMRDWCSFLGQEMLHWPSCDQTSGSTGVPSAFTASRAARIQPQRLQDRRRYLRGCRFGRDGLCREAWMRYQQHDIGIVMREAAVIRDHRRAAGVGYAHVRGHDNVRRPRILPRPQPPTL
jgi:hypothetical protein